MKIKKSVIRDIYQTAQLIAEMDTKRGYIRVTDHGNGRQTARRVSAIEEAQELAVHIVDAIDCNCDQDFDEKDLQLTDADTTGIPLENEEEDHE